MDPTLFQEFLQKINEISKNLKNLVDNQKIISDNLEEITDSSDTLKGRKSQKLSPGERKIESEKGSIYAKEFEKVFSNFKKSDNKLDGMLKKNYINVNIDSIGRKALKQLLKVLSDSALEELNQKTKQEKNKKSSSESGGIFGFLKTLGTFGLLFSVIKNIDKIAGSIESLLRSAKENLPVIGTALKNTFLPFFEAAIGPINKLIDKLPVLLDIFLKNLPVARRELTSFINETDPVKLLKIGGAILALYVAWKTIQTVKGVADAFTSPAAALNNFNSILKSINLALLGVTLVAFAKSFETFSDTIVKYKDIDWETMAKAGVSLAALFASLKVASSFISAGDAFKALIASVVGGAGLAVALRELAWGIEPWKNIPENVAKTAGMAIAGLIASLGALTVAGMAGPLPALFGAVGLLAAEGTLILGLRGIAEMFRATMSVWEALPDIFKKFADLNYNNIFQVAGAITKLAGALALTSISGGASALSSTLTDVWSKFTGQKSPVEKFKEFESIDGDRLMKTANGIESIFKALSKGGTDNIREAIKNLNSIEYDKLGNITNVPPPAQPGLNQPKSEIAQDFISRPGQPPLQFSSQDNILSFKDAKIFDPIIQKIESSNKSEELATLFNELKSKLTDLLTLQKEQNIISKTSSERLLAIREKDNQSSNVVVNNSSSQMVLTQKSSSNLDFRRGLLAVNY